MSISALEIISTDADGSVSVLPVAFGSSIEVCANAAVELSQQLGTVVRCQFNAFNFVADPSTTADQIVALFWASVTEAASQLVPMRQEQSVQALLSVLPMVIADEPKLVAWVGQLALFDHSDGVGSANAGPIADQLEQAGYVANDLVGDVKRDPSQHEHARWIVGQAIAMLRSGNVHPVLAAHAVKYAALKKNVNGDQP